MPFTDPRLPGKEYKTERGLQTGLRALEKRERGAVIAADEATHLLAGETPPQPEPYTGPYFLRNLRLVPIRLRFGDKKDGRAVNLRPRGQRGDVSPPLQPGDEYDAAMADLGVLFEILTADQVAQVFHGQTTNQQAVHPALAQLRTATGEAVTSVKIEEEFNAQGFTVGTVVEQGPNNSNQQRSVVQRSPQIDLAVAPERAQLPGTQDRPIASVSQSIDPEDQAAWVAEQGGLEELMRRDALARQKGADGPGAGLGGLRAPQAFAPVVETRHDDGQMDPTTRTPEVPVTGSGAF